MVALLNLSLAQNCTEEETCHLAAYPGSFDSVCYQKLSIGNLSGGGCGCSYMSVTYAWPECGQLTIASWLAVIFRSVNLAMKLIMLRFALIELERYYRKGGLKLSNMQVYTLFCIAAAQPFSFLWHLYYALRIVLQAAGGDVSLIPTLHSFCTAPLG